MKNKILTGHLMTLFTILIWGTTFISTKVLLRSMSPIEVLFCRFLLGYVLLFLLYPKMHRFGSFREELRYLACGISGVTLYFLMENTALVYTDASNVGLLVSVAPVLTAVLAHLFTKDEKFTLNLFWGFLISMAGIFLVIGGGSLVLKLNPLGDILAVAAAACWAIYSNLLKRIGGGYGVLYVTRKIFFYGLLTMLPVMLVLRPKLSVALFMQPLVLPNLLFLGIVASALCYVLWGAAVGRIGVVKTTNYIYLIPLVTMLFAALILHEKITLFTAGGAVLILSGVYVSEHGFGKKKRVPPEDPALTDPFLAEPTKEFQKSFEKYASEYQKARDTHYYERYKKGIDDFDGYLNDLSDYSKGVNLLPDDVATSTYWLIDQGEVVGVVRVRHTEAPCAGHIGYDISPCHRNKGYGTQILRLALMKANELGIYDAIVTCSTNNTASKKIIENNNGKYIGTVFDEEENENLYRYSISTTSCV